MPRTARLHRPETVVHFIARFVNEEWLMSGPGPRAAYLERLAKAIAHTDWQVLAYALMSSHIHMVLLSGAAVPWSLYQRLHTSFGLWLNALYQRLGPVFAGRPTTIYVPPERTGQLIAYVHNNPVRARVVAAADDTDWTSHRAMLGMGPAPAGVNVARGLELAGYGTDSEARMRFHEMVVSRSGDPRDPELSVASLARQRALIRAELALPVELSAPSVIPETGRFERQLLYGGVPPVAPRWEGELAAVVRCVAARSGVPVEAILSRTHVPRVVLARRTVVVAAVMFLRRRTQEVGAALAISDAAVSKHLARAETVIAEATEVARVVRDPASTSIAA